MTTKDLAFRQTSPPLAQQRPAAAAQQATVAAVELWRPGLVGMVAPPQTVQLRWCGCWGTGPGSLRHSERSCKCSQLLSSHRSYDLLYFCLHLRLSVGGPAGFAPLAARAGQHAKRIATGLTYTTSHRTTSAGNGLKTCWRLRPGAPAHLRRQRSSAASAASSPPAKVLAAVRRGPCTMRLF